MRTPGRALNQRLAIRLPPKSNHSRVDVDSRKHVEGREQKSEAEFRRFLRYALSSTSELEYHLTIARDINVISAADFVGVLVPLKEVRMMLFGLLKRLDSPTSRSIERDNPLSGG